MSVIAQAGAKGRQLHKFGGSSLADVKCYLRVAGIMAEYSQPDDMMVVSAAGSTTNQLINWLKLSQTDRLSAHQVQQTLRRYQCDLISGLLPAEEADSLISAFVSEPGLMPASFYALNAPHNRRLMKGFLTRCCNSCWCNIRANVWW